MANNLTQRITRWIGDTLDTHAAKDDISFVTGLTPLPPEGVPALTAVFYLPGPVVGAGPLMHMHAWPAASLATKEGVAADVASIIESMLARRSQMLSEHMGVPAPRGVG